MTNTTEDDRLPLRLLEAVLFANNEPLSLAVLQDQLGEGADAVALLKELQEEYATRGVNLVETDGAWSFRTALDLSDKMKIVRQPRRKLPRAASEVLAIIAYHQPITRSEIESIRGVETSRGTLDILLELGWIRPGKRRETPGRPLTWQTTPEFLSHLNLSSLNDLPGLDDLKAAGLLDSRPILETLPSEKDETSADIDDEEAFSEWVKDDPDQTAAE
ncbi:MAG: SMC-Scp complex subunit ScpB [Alphaproteobacteria bacterium]|nr:SMC-Scp complex subunit ScpB [Alphaproteobacteria bacterium]